MINAQEKTIKIIMLIILLAFFFLTAYFVGETREIEKFYDDLISEGLIEKI